MGLLNHISTDGIKAQIEHANHEVYSIREKLEKHGDEFSVEERDLLEDYILCQRKLALDLVSMLIVMRRGS